MSGLAIVAIFLVLAALMVARKLPALLAVPLMALGIGAVAGVGWSGLGNIVATGSIQLAATIATLIFGAWLSRVVLSTGIAESIVTLAAEFGGDRPMVLALALCAAVALLFTSVTGLGAIIMIGTIVLPVMMTVGVPRTTAATLFLLAFGLGYIFNLAQWKFYGQVFGVEQSAFAGYIGVLATIDAVVLLVYAAVQARTTRDYATFALAPPPTRKRRVHPLALITPILPLVLYKVLGVDATVAFALAALYGALVTRPRDLVQTLVGAWIRGVEDVAPALILMIGIGMLLAAAKLPAVVAAIGPVIAAVAPRSPLAYVVIFGLLSPLALYRGPLNVFGVGIGVFTVLAAMHVMPALALVAAVMAVVQVQNVCDPTNTQNVWVANFTGVGVDRIMRMTLPYQVAVATLAVLAVVLFGGRLFGTPQFAVTHAAAAAEVGGLTAPSSAARVIAVLPTDANADDAAEAIEAMIARGWPSFSAIPLHEDPAVTDCARKAYAAVLRVSVTRADIGASDVGVELLDCAGWSVDQWHEQGADIRRLALGALFRVHTWTLDHPVLAANVFERGLDYDPVSGPTYFYVLFKPSDGYMRALARPGGPAYVAGLRTGDVIDKLDGRFWWQYGTFQTQARAYDGKPHSFDVQRGRVGGPAVHVQLGAPFMGTPETGIAAPLRETGGNDRSTR